MKRLGWMTMSVLLAAALCCATAYAASDSLLEHVFCDSEPTPAAREALKRVDLTTEADGLRFSVEEVLFDGNRLLFSCSAANETGAPRLLALRAELPQAFDAELPDELSPECFLYLQAEEMRTFDLPAGELVKAPFKVQLTASFAAPAARFLGEEDGEALNFSGVPTLLRRDDGLVYPCSQCAYERVIKASGGTRTTCEWEAPELGQAPSIEDYVEFGYLADPLTMSLGFEVQPSAQHTVVAGATHVVKNGFVYDVQRADFAAASTRIRFQLRCPEDYLPANMAAFEALWKEEGRAAPLEFSAYADGREIEDLSCSCGIEEDEAGGLYYDVELKGSPVDPLPKELRVVPMLSGAAGNGRQDDSLGQYAIALQLRLDA